MAQKIIKDSVHGYIALDDIFLRIVDSPEFQRLKYIEQGSFRILYPAARHDRFIHSLGTFYLSKKFANNFVFNIKEDLGIEIDNTILEKILNTFYYAALLHDIGHAPFSHTTEKFFRCKTIRDKEIAINQQLFDAIQKVSTDSELKKFINEFSSCSPSPHEIISATILIEKAKDFLEDNKDEVFLELAARMVIGCTYDYNNIEINNDLDKNVYGIKNCFIRLLNSSTVDVDKLDYITRDSQMSGFLNVPIDIDRLVKSVTAIKEEGWIYPAFRKNALSVIDNVFRAKMEQSFWMVSHPVVVYDSELLSHCINLLSTYINNDYIENIFTIEALSNDGVNFNDKKYRLLNDIDISSDLRQFYEENVLFKELYDRGSRHHPIWKSYYEYKYLFDNDIQEKVFLFFKGLMDYMEVHQLFVLDIDKYIELEHDENSSQKIIDAATFLKKFCDKNKVLFDFVILPSSSSFSPKFDPKLVYINFGKLHKNGQPNYVTYEYLKGPVKTDDKKRMFYLYSKQKFSTELIETFINDLIKVVKSRNRSRV